MEEALIFFDNKGWPYWRIEQGNKRLDHDDSGDVQAAKISLMNHLALLTPGGYTLKVRPGLKADAGQNQLDFMIARTAKTTASPVTTQANLVEQLEAARQAGIKEGEQKATIEFRLKAVEDAVNDLRVQLGKLLNDDEEDDAPALSRIGDIAAQLPNLMNGLAALKVK